MTTPEERIARLEAEHEAVREKLGDIEASVAAHAASISDITAAKNRLLGGVAALIAAGGFIGWAWSWFEKIGKLGR